MIIKLKCKIASCTLMINMGVKSVATNAVVTSIATNYCDCSWSGSQLSAINSPTSCTIYIILNGLPQLLVSIGSIFLILHFLYTLFLHHSSLFISYKCIYKFSISLSWRIKLEDEELKLENCKCNILWYMLNKCRINMYV